MPIGCERHIFSAIQLPGDSRILGGGQGFAKYNFLFSQSLLRRVIFQVIGRDKIHYGLRFTAHPSNRVVPLTDILFVMLGSLASLLMASAAMHVGLRLADRMPGEAYWPECLYCQRPARPHEMLPIFGWLLRPQALQFPCPCAQQKRQWAVPAAEITALLCGTVASGLGGASFGTLWICLAMGLLPAIAIVDLLFGIIPDWFNIALALFGFGWLLAGGGEMTIGLMMGGIMLLLGLLMAYGYSWLRRKEMLGLGDVKFFAAAGLWLQMTTLIWFLIIAGFLGAINGLIWKRVMGSEQSPFAPALCLSLLGCLFYQLATKP